MKLNIKLSKIANFFFFLSNLTEWHFSCRKDYNEVWLKNHPLSNEEKESLEKLRNILKKHGIRNNQEKITYLGRFFYLYNNKECWKKLSYEVNSRDFEEIKKTFSLFKKRFELIWKEYKDDRIKIFRKEISNKRVKSLFKDLSFFFNNNQKDNINVVLLISPLEKEATASGSSNTGNNSVTFEYPKLELNSWQIKHAIGVLAHEIAHLFFDQRYIKYLKNAVIEEFSDKKLSNHFDLKSIIEESVVSSFAPTGYLVQKYFNFSIGSLFFNDLDKLLNVEDVKKLRVLIVKYAVWQLMPINMYYLKNKKIIDEKYIFKTAKIIKEILK
ncbi:MAG: hypothetical protein PHZ25_00930 [Candidatus Pacebacteria bacterium]|nr:hypothetical protein [Candidatus Paceibacterota bacterium]